MELPPWARTAEHRSESAPPHVPRKQAKRTETARKATADAQ